MTRQPGETPLHLPILERESQLQVLEASWMAGDPSPVLDDVHATFADACARGDRWGAGELGAWMSRSGMAVDPACCAEPFAFEIAGEHAAAAAAWSARGLPLMAARACAASGTEAGLRAAFDEFVGIGAKADAARASRLLREMGAKRIPRGPRASTRANAEGLTARELEVLGMLARGATNRQIAEELFLSEKTVGHHVSAVLAKLGVPTRREAAARAKALGIIEDRDIPAAI